ncbi:MAG: N-6 DNA methylase [Propionicimonas sp.]
MPPAKNGDFAWIQHMVASMKEDTGRVGVVMPHGVLFRGGKEGEIRRCLLEKDLLEAAVGLPPNLFYSTSIPVCLLIWRHTKSAERQGKVLFIDASKRLKPGKNQNTMDDADIAAIHAAYARGEDTDGDGGVAVRLVNLDEIAGNDYDLKIGRYLQSAHTAEVDVEAALVAYRDAREALRAAERTLDAKLRAAGFDA